MPEYRYTITAEAMLEPEPLRWYGRLWRKLLRRPMPQPIQPPGTRPVTFDTTDADGTVRRFYLPAARVEVVEQ